MLCEFDRRMRGLASFRGVRHPQLVKDADDRPSSSAAMAQESGYVPSGGGVSDERRGQRPMPPVARRRVAGGGAAVRSVRIASHRVAKNLSRRAFVAGCGPAPPSARSCCLTERALPPWCASRPLDAIGGSVRMLFDERRCTERRTEGSAARRTRFRRFGACALYSMQERDS